MVKWVAASWVKIRGMWVELCRCVCINSRGCVDSVGVCLCVYMVCVCWQGKAAFRGAQLVVSEFI